MWKIYISVISTSIVVCWKW